MSRVPNVVFVIIFLWWWARAWYAAGSSKVYSAVEVVAQAEATEGAFPVPAHTPGVTQDMNDLSTHIANPTLVGLVRRTSPFVRPQEGPALDLDDFNVDAD